MFEFFNSIISSISISGIMNFLELKKPLDFLKALVDIGILSFIIYKLIQLVRETRAIQLIKGIAVIIIAFYVSDLIGLKTIAYVLKNTIQIATFALVVLFQPELRRALEKIGRSRFSSVFNFDEENTSIKITSMIEEVIKAVTVLSNSKIGALIVLEREIKLGEFINTGIQLDSNVTSELLINIFSPNTPLHDGAVVIRENKIQAGACFLPLTDNQNLSKELGTRHRAALGISEVSDSIVVVVSEESGKISFALSGGLTRNLTTDILRKALNKNLLEKTTTAKKLTLWKVKKSE